MGEEGEEKGRFNQTVWFGHGGSIETVPSETEGSETEEVTDFSYFPSSYFLKLYIEYTWSAVQFHFSKPLKI